MARDSAGLRFLATQMIGYDAMQWWQDEDNERDNWLRMGAAHEAGWVTEWVGPTDNSGWTIAATGRLLSVADDTLADVLRPDPAGKRPFLGVNRRGEVLEVLRGAIYTAAGVQVEVPDDSTWYTLIARYATDTRAPGTLTLVGGAATVVGVGTQFTRYATAAAAGGPTRIRIAAADTVNGNDYVTAFATITDDTNATLAAVAPGNSESGVRFRVRGEFYGKTPADPDIHRNASVTWELVARTCVRPTDGALIVADVRSVAGVVTTIDRRRANVWRPFTGESVSYALALAGFYKPNNGDPPESKEVVFSYGGTSGTPNTPVALDIAASATGAHIVGVTVDQPTGLLAAAVYDTGATRGIKVQEWSTLYSSLSGGTSAGRWDDPNDGAAVDIATGAGLKDVALVTLPEGCGFTHIAFYVDNSGTILSKTSVNNGASWVGPVTVLAGQSVLRVSATLTRLQRLVLVFVSSVDPYVRSLYSDDLGASFVGGTGTDLAIDSDANIQDVAVCEDDRGALWVATGWATSTNNPVRLFRGQAEGNVVPDAVGETKVGPGTSATVQCSQVAIRALPNGHVVVMAEARDGSTVHAWATVVANRKPVALYVIANTVDTNGSGRTSPVAIGQLANGELALTWTRYDNAALNQAYSLRYIPCAVYRPNTLFGYRA